MNDFINENISLYYIKIHMSNGIRFDLGMFLKYEIELVLTL